MYFPKTQIKTNLYTNGKELYLSTNSSEYIGYYYRLANGSFFTGKTPQDKPNIRLILIPDPQPLEEENPEPNKYITPIGYATYYPSDFSIINYPLYRNITKLAPPYSPNIPTDNDYKIGEYRRYFCKKINEIIYIEIDVNFYNKLVSKNSEVAFEYYTPFNIPWKLIGDKEQVFKVNKNIVELTMKQLKLSSFNKYLKEDYVKYYK
jgi:hypothetical protein